MDELLELLNKDETGREERKEKTMKCAGSAVNTSN